MIENSGRETRSASAGLLGLRIDELETSALQALDVVDLGTVEILSAHHVDVDGNPMRFEGLVEIAGFVFEEQIIGKTGTSAADDTNSQALTREAFRISDLFDLLCSACGEVQHRTPS